jgi:hypothetical protein
MRPFTFEFARKLGPIRSDPGEGSELRIPVLMCLAGHTDSLERCWPKRDTIARELEADPGTVGIALQWLMDHGAIYNAPYDKRVDDELKLHPRKIVF